MVTPLRRRTQAAQPGKIASRAPCSSAGWGLARGAHLLAAGLAAGLAAACASAAPSPTSPPVGTASDGSPPSALAGSWQLHLTASWRTFETREVVRKGTLSGSATLVLDPTGEATLCTDATLHDGRSAGAFAPGGPSEGEQVRIERIGGKGRWSPDGAVHFDEPAPCGSGSAAGLALRCALDGERLRCAVSPRADGAGLSEGPPLLALNPANAPWSLPRDADAGSSALWFSPLLASRALALTQPDPWRWAFDAAWGPPSSAPPQGATPANQSHLVGANDAACAWREGGDLWCWGRNDLGRLGAPLAAAEVSQPHRVDGGLAPTSVSVGGSVCTSGDQVACLVDVGGARPRRWAPVAGLADAVELASDGATSCARRRGGAVACWDGGYGAQPVEVPGLTAIAQLVGGEGRYCARRTDGLVACWGQDDRLPAAPRWVDMPPARWISVGSNSCAVGEDALVRCWGTNDRGEAGRQGGTDAQPQVVDPALHASRVAVGVGRVCAVPEPGDGLVCWGGDDADWSTAREDCPAGYTVDAFIGAKVGGSRRTFCAAPRRVPIDATGGLIAAGRFFCAADAAAVIRCWGPGVPGRTGAEPQPFALGADPIRKVGM